MIETFTIAGNNYPSYVSVAKANVYIEIEPSYREAWIALNEEAKRRALVAATRDIDSFAYIGEKTDPQQPTEWPRMDVGDVDGQDPPRRIETATIIVAGEIALDPAYSLTGTNTSTTTGQGGVKRVRSDRLSVEYFQKSTKTVTINTPYPLIDNIQTDEVARLLQPYLQLDPRQYRIPGAAQLPESRSGAELYTSESEWWTEGAETYLGNFND